MQNEMYKLAMSYLARGWSVLPCGGNKIPVIPWKHLQERFPTEEEVRGWFERFPYAQVGIITGSISNLTVVDVEKDGDPSFLPQETMIVETGGKGYHYYFQYEEGVTNKARIKDLVDIRSEGGYVVAAGSTSDKGPYTMLQDVSLLPFPKELFPTPVDVFSLPESSSGHYESKPITSYAGASQGSRNDEIARYVGSILTRIHPSNWESEAWPMVQTANSQNTPPLPLNELRKTFESLVRTEVSKHPLRHTGGDAGGFRGFSGSQPQEPIILDDGSDEVKLLSQVAAEQQLNTSDIYPLQMPCFDKAILGGVCPGDLVVVAGQTGHGKTSLVQDWTFSLIRGEKHPKSLWFSYEVLPTHLWSKFQEMGMKPEECVFIPAKHSSGNVAWVEHKIKEGKEKYGIKVVMIDHLGFLLPKTEGTMGRNLSANYATFLTQIVRDLKTIALREEIIIFLPVHMRKAERGSKRSEIDDIKDSAGIGQEADLVFLIEREKEKDQDSHSYFTDVTRITLAKNRKTGQTVIGKFSMINGRFAYDDSEEKAMEIFNSIPEKVKVELPKVVITQPEVLVDDDDDWNEQVNSF
jgi:hypothetical protein